MSKIEEFTNTIYYILEIFVGLSVLFSGMVVAMYYDQPIAVIGVFAFLSGIFKTAKCIRGRLREVFK